MGRNSPPGTQYSGRHSRPVCFSFVHQERNILNPCGPHPNQHLTNTAKPGAGISPDVNLVFRAFPKVVVDQGGQLIGSTSFHFQITPEKHIPSAHHRGGHRVLPARLSHWHRMANFRQIRRDTTMSRWNHHHECHNQDHHDGRKCANVNAANESF